MIETAEENRGNSSAQDFAVVMKPDAEKLQAGGGQEKRLSAGKISDT